MKFKIFALVVLLLVSVTGCSAPNNEKTETELDTTVSSEISNQADTDLVRVKTKEAYVEDPLSRENEFIYNDEGQLDKVISWSGFKPSETGYKYMYEYYDNGQVKLSQRYENIDGQYAVQQELKFDENGYIYEQIGYSGGIDRRAPDYNLYTYDEDGNMIKDEHYYDLDELDFVKTYKYDDKGELIESTYTKYNYLPRHSVYYYNNFGYPSVEIEYDLDKNLECLYLYSYDCDYDNAPLKLTAYKETNPTKIEEVMSSTQFPLIDVRDNDVGIHFKEEDALYVKVFNYEYVAFTKQQKEILDAKKKAYIDISVWGYSYQRDYQ